MRSKQTLEKLILDLDNEMEAISQDTAALEDEIETNVDRYNTLEDMKHDALIELMSFVN